MLTMVLSERDKEWASSGISTATPLWHKERTRHGPHLSRGERSDCALARLRASQVGVKPIESPRAPYPALRHSRCLHRRSKERRPEAAYASPYMGEVDSWRCPAPTETLQIVAPLTGRSGRLSF